MSGKLRVCGNVNAKNGFGGYGGQSGFVVEFNGDKATLAFEEDDFQRTTRREWCEQLAADLANAKTNVTSKTSPTLVDLPL